MSTTVQTLPASLEFPPGRTVVTVREIAAKLGFSPEHVVGWIEDGSISAMDGTRRIGTRPAWRVTVEAYRDFVRSRLLSGADRESAGGSKILSDQRSDSISGLCKASQTHRP